MTIPQSVTKVGSLSIRSTPPLAAELQLRGAGFGLKADEPRTIEEIPYEHQRKHDVNLSPQLRHSTILPSLERIFPIAETCILKASVAKLCSLERTTTRGESSEATQHVI